MYAIAMNGLYWNAALAAFSPDATRYETEGEASEAAQEDARLAPDTPWSVVRI